ncbi:MAG: hypothetical protein JXL97_01505 [Bacteroidales bacterium]|nr:hypothetical protein [Bacteroidales bacterium]
MEVTIKINTEKEEAKSLIQYLRSLSFVKIENPEEENEDTEIETENLINLMKESKKSGYLTSKEKNKLLENI